MTMKLLKSSSALVCGLLAFLPFLAEALISEELQCGLRIFVPFTYKGLTTTMTASGSRSVGFTHMAAAWLAMEHFNNRDSSVVEELGSEIYQDCTIKFKMNEGGKSIENITDGTFFFDSASKGHQGNQLLYESVQAGYQVPCAIVGPYHNEPTQYAATMASSARVPLVPSGGIDARLAEGPLSQYTSTIYPRMYDITIALANFLAVNKRNDYVAFLHSYSDVGIQFQEAVSLAMDLLGATQRQNFGYLSVSTPIQVSGLNVSDAVQKVKGSGFRTIVVVMDDPVFELPEIADVAVGAGLAADEYMWIFLPPYLEQTVRTLVTIPDSLRAVFDPPIPSYKNVPKLLSGAALIHPVEGFQVHPDDDKFAKAWRSVDQSFVERLNQQGVVITSTGMRRAGEQERAWVEFFQTSPPEPGSGYLFDAVMATGMGACLTQRQKHRLQKLRRLQEQEDQLAVPTAKNVTEMISSEEHIAGIRAVSFFGASGRIELGVSPGFLQNVTTARLTNHTTIGIYNLFPPDSDAVVDGNWANGSMVLTATLSDFAVRGHLQKVLNGEDASKFITVEEFRTFVFRDGTTTPPALLRDPADQNYLNPALRYIGLSMMALALVCSFLFGIWVVINRNHRIVRASQPHFLYLLILGAALTSLSIFGISTDESWGFSSKQLGRQCMSIVWLASTGHVSTYGALFTKLWRVNKVLQFSRRRVDSSRLAWPSVLLMIAALTIVTLWQSLDPLRWERVELDPVTGESIGLCLSDTMDYYIIALGLVMLIPSVATAVMAWKTRDVDDAYSESSWICTLAIVQLEVIIVSVPMVKILRGISTDGKYIGQVMLLWSMPMSTILLIMVPKVIAHYRVATGLNRVSKTRGSAAGAVRVSGVPGSVDNGQPNGRHSNQSNHASSRQNGPAFAVQRDSDDEFAAE